MEEEGSIQGGGKKKKKGREELPATKDFSLSTQCPGVSGFPVYILLEGCSSSSLHPNYHGAREYFIEGGGEGFIIIIIIIIPLRLEADK